MTVEEHLAKARAVASLIDQTLLKPEATEQDIFRLCADALEYKFAAICVNPCWVTAARERLADSPVRICTVVGFPLGANESQVKIKEAVLALTQGAHEIDMVQNIGALRSGHFAVVRQEIAALADLAHFHGARLKVILETCLLSDEQKKIASRLAGEAKADFVKTSTGFSTGGATEADVRLMREVVGAALGVKASGGIRSLDALRGMVQAGANRIGTSSGPQILRELAGEANAPSAAPVAAGKVPGGQSDAY